MRLFFDHCGPMVRYRDHTLYVSSLNPEVSTSWRMSRMEMVQLGLRCLFAALFAG